MTIRKATEADLPRLIELTNELSIGEAREDLTHDYRDAFRAVTSDSNQCLLVIEDEAGIVVGTLVLLMVPNLSYKGRPWALLENVVVDQTMRGKGIGKELVMHAVELARLAGCYKVTLTSNKARGDAHRFYEHLGFTATHEGFRYDLT